MNTSFLYGLIVGCLTTVIGQYYFKKLVIHDNDRRHDEKIKHKTHALEKLFIESPDFMNSLKHDINNPEYANIREFLVVDKNAILNASVPRFRYELSETILPVLNALDKLGHIKAFKNNCLHYKMEEDFIIQMRGHKEGT